MRIAILLIILSGGVALAGTNLTAEECLSIERVASVRRSPKTVNAVENNPAYLHCAVGSGAESSDFLVAWTRLRDDALLTAGGRAFTSDARFQISPKRRTRDWVLLIRRVQVEDAGCYLCEINTEPSSTLVPVYLNVIPVQEIPKRLYVSGTRSAHAVRNSNLVARMEGDAILLNCTVNVAADEDQTRRHGTPISDVGEVLWTKDNVPIELDVGDLKYTAFASVTPAGGVVYVLRIARASTSDDGVYACEGENLARSAQMVQINAAATDAAVSGAPNGSSTAQFRPSTFIYLYLILLIISLISRFHLFFSFL